MRIRRSWLAAAAGVLIAIGAASVPWSLSPDLVALRLDEVTTPYGYHWVSPGGATLRAFPEPILDLNDVRLADSSGKTVFTASTIAIRLSIADLLVGRFTPVRARLKDPVGDVDLDALTATLPRLAEGPPVASLQARGGRLRLKSARLGLDETLASMSASFAWSGASVLFHANVAGLWRGQWTTLEARVGSPRDLLAGQATDVGLDLSAAGAKANFEGNALLGDKPTFAGAIALNARSLAELAGWTGFDATSLPDSEAAISGKGSLSPGSLTLEDGRLLLKGQTLDGELDLQHGPKGWSASATLAADGLDLTALLGPFPALRSLEGGWSHAPISLPLPPIDLDMRLSAVNAIWGALALSDAAVSITRRDDETTFKVLEASLAHGSASGEIIVRDCVERCTTRATLSLVNADAAALARMLGKESLTGAAAIDLDLTASGDTPAALVASAEGELAFTIRDGALVGVNFEEALRRSQRRTLDLTRDLLVGQTPFRKAEGKLFFADGEAETRDVRLTGPGVAVTGKCAIDLDGQGLQGVFDARQADALGHVSPGGASIELDLHGPWRSPALEGQTLPN